ncbi:MAG: hypothetical protein ACOY82_16250 [Pseudomonadota bacterium]
MPTRSTTPMADSGAASLLRSLRIAALVAWLASAPIGAMAQTPAAESPLPEGVVLRPANDAAKAQGKTRLEALLADRRPATWSAAMSDAPVEGRASFMLGTFAGMDLTDRADFELSRTHHGNGVVPLTPDTPLHYRMIGATTRAQRDYLAPHLLESLPDGAPDAIRPADFDELALIWYFIGWDLDEPLYVARWGERRYAFDFDPGTGRLTWVERLSSPCFSLGTDENEVLLKCHCMSIARDGARWASRFQPADASSSCPK